MNEQNQDQGSETQAGDEDIRSSEGGENVSDDGASPSEETKTESPEEAALKVLNEATGESFKDLDTAKKSIKDLKSFTGQKVEDAGKKLEESGEYIKAADLEEMLFFRVRSPRAFFTSNA